MLDKYFQLVTFVSSFFAANQCSTTQAPVTSPPTTPPTTTVSYYEDKTYSAYVNLVDDEFQADDVGDFITDAWTDANTGRVHYFAE